MCIFKKQDCSSQKNRSARLDDYLQYHIPSTFMLVYVSPHICWDLLWKRHKHLLGMNAVLEAPPQGGRWGPKRQSGVCTEGAGAEKLLWGSWKSAWCCKWSPVIPVRRCADLKSTRRHNRGPSGCLHTITIWVNEKCIYCKIQMQGIVGINSILTTRLGDMHPYTGVSPHVWLHVFGRYFTKHLSGNLRCWYSCYPSHPLHLSPPATCTAFSGKGQRVWSWAARVSDLRGQTRFNVLNSKRTLLPAWFLPISPDLQTSYSHTR